MDTTQRGSGIWSYTCRTQVEILTFDTLSLGEPLKLSESQDSEFEPGGHGTRSSHRSHHVRAAGERWAYRAHDAIGTNDKATGDKTRREETRRDATRFFSGGGIEYMCFVLCVSLRVSQARPVSH